MSLKRSFGYLEVCAIAINVGIQATRISQRDMRLQMLPALQSAAQEVGQRLPE
jgi:hypothetical protein